MKYDICSDMDGPNIMLSKLKQSKKDKHYTLYVEYKRQYKWIYKQNRNRLTNIENLRLPKRREGTN